MPSVIICAPKPAPRRREGTRKKMVSVGRGDSPVEIRKKTRRLKGLIEKVPGLVEQTKKHLSYFEREWDTATPNHLRQAATAGFFDLARFDAELAALEKDILTAFCDVLGIVSVVARDASFTKKLKRLQKQKEK